MGNPVSFVGYPKVWYPVWGSVRARREQKPAKACKGSARHTNYGVWGRGDKALDHKIFIHDSSNIEEWTIQRMGMTRNHLRESVPASFLISVKVPPGNKSQSSVPPFNLLFCQFLRHQQISITNIRQTLSSLILEVLVILEVRLTLPAISGVVSRQTPR